MTATEFGKLERFLSICQISMTTHYIHSYAIAITTVIVKPQLDHKVISEVCPPIQVNVF